MNDVVFSIKPDENVMSKQELSLEVVHIKSELTRLKNDISNLAHFLKLELVPKSFTISLVRKYTIIKNALKM